MIIDKVAELYPFEVKSSKTKGQHLFDNLKFWKKLNGTPTEKLNLIYGGDDNFTTS